MGRKWRIEEMDRLTPEEYHACAVRLPAVVVLDHIRSRHNVGAVFRTADGMLYEHLYLCGFTPCPPDAGIHKTALGAEEAVPWSHAPTTEEVLLALKEQGYLLVAVEQAEESIRPEELASVVPNCVPVALVLGNEVEGVQQQVVDLCDYCVEIPQYGTKHSLNVSVAAGIVMWELSKCLQRTSVVSDLR